VSTFASYSEVHAFTKLGELVFHDKDANLLKSLYLTNLTLSKISLSVGSESKVLHLKSLANYS
jgi:hypothetical protein